MAEMKVETKGSSESIICSFDMIASIALHMWCTVPSRGFPRGYPMKITESREEAVLHLKTDGEAPKSMAEFIAFGEQMGLDKKTLEKWFPRMLLAESCSKLISFFLTFNLPGLLKCVQKFKFPNGEVVDLSEIPGNGYRVNFIPELPRHAVVDSDGNKRGIEVPYYAQTASHDVLQFGEIFVDLTGGQFRGVFVPKYFSSEQDFLENLPGKVVNSRSIGLAGDSMVLTDAELTILINCMKNVDKGSPLKICRWCFCEARKSCARCKKAYYCGKVCQQRDWRAKHKEQCSENRYW